MEIAIDHLSPVFASVGDPILDELLDEEYELYADLWRVGFRIQERLKELPEDMELTPVPRDASSREARKLRAESND